MVMEDIETISDLERALTAGGAKLTPVEQEMDAVSDLVTADGQFTVSQPQTLDRNGRPRQVNMVTLYRTDTGEPIPTDTNLVLVRLKKRYPTHGMFAEDHPELAGRKAFWLGRQNEETGEFEAPPRKMLGSMFCMLHKDSPDFEYTRSLGVQSVCRYHLIPNVIELERHMKSRHADVHELMERKRTDRERLEDRQDLKNLIEMALTQRGTDQVKASELQAAVEAAKAPAAGDQPPAAPPVTTAKYQEPCDECAFVAEGSRHRVALGRLDGHKKKEHKT